jgi:hypothetical protein
MSKETFLMIAGLTSPIWILITIFGAVIWLANYERKILG